MASDNDKLRIAILSTRYSPPFFRGGEEHVTHYLSQQLRSRGHHVDVYARTLRKWRNLDEQSTADNVHRVTCSNIKVATHRQFARRVRTPLAKGRYDVILNTHITLSPGLTDVPEVVLVATTAQGEAQAINGATPSRIIERFLRRSVSAPLEKSILPRCAHVVCVNNHIQNEVRQWFGVSPDHTSVIGNGVDAQRYSPATDRDRQGPCSLLYVGRLVNRKNVNLLVRSAKILSDSNTVFKLNIVGDGPERSTLEIQTKELGLGQHVHFHGRQSGDNLLRFYQEADLFVLPSRYEGMPLVLLEALSCGLPSVVADFAGAKDIVQDDVTGAVLKKDTPEELALCLADLMSDPDKRVRLGAHARALILDRFSWSRIMDQYLDLIAHILEKQS